MDSIKKRKLSLKERKYANGQYDNEKCDMVVRNNSETLRTSEKSCISKHVPLSDKLTGSNRSDDKEKFTTLPPFKGFIEEDSERSELATESYSTPDIKRPSESAFSLPPFCFKCAKRKEMEQSGPDILVMAFEELENEGQLKTENKTTLVAENNLQTNIMDNFQTDPLGFQTEQKLLTSGKFSSSSESSVVKDSNMKTEKKNTNSLQSCPMCQQQFDIGHGSMEIDAHLAQCLSSTDDDIVW